MTCLYTPDGTAYDLIGPEDAPIVALIHGLGLCRALWEPHLAAFGSRYRVMNYDLYGHGDSAPPPTSASLSVYADQLARLLDHIGVQRAAVVGFSIGGMINRRFALDYGERVASVVVMNSPHDRGEAAQQQVEGRARTVRDQGALSTMDAALARWFTPTFRNARPDVMNLVRDWRSQADAESYAQAAWVLAHGVRELIQPDPPIDVPTLVLTCENDTGSTPSMSRAIAEEIEGAELLVIPALQHLGLMEEPDAFTAPILSFLDRQARKVTSIDNPPGVSANGP
jgi:pimeloyl-ACP methyl ester carboxylesterase